MYDAGEEHGGSFAPEGSLLVIENHAIGRPTDDPFTHAFSPILRL